jgi:hypothetical protein
MSMLKNYWAPTPKRWKKIGDALLATSTVITVGGMLNFENLKEIFTIAQIRWITIAPMILGVIGKFLTNFFKDPETPNLEN